MKKTFFTLALLFGVSGIFAGCNKQAAAPGAGSDITTLEQDTNQLDKDTKQDVLQDDAQAPTMSVKPSASPTTESSDVDTLDKDLTNMKLDNETFQ